MAGHRSPSRRRHAALLLVLATLLCGCDGGGDDPGSTTPASSPDPQTSTSDPPPAGASKRPAELWFTTGEQFRKVERELPARGSELVAATEALIEGPTARERRADVEAQTQIPADVAVEDVTVSGRGTAVVEVSPAFMAGIPREPADRDRAEAEELSARVGQVAYTLTQFERVRAAKVIAGGEAVEPAVEREDYAKPATGPTRKARPRGTESPDTRALQQRLAELRFLPKGAVDGVDGYRTQQAVIAFQSWNGLERDGIVGPVTTAALARAKRPKPAGRGPSRRIEVYREKGVALLIQDDRTKRAIHVSAGQPATPTPAGSYRVFRKELRSWSVPFGVWLPYASYFNQGIAFHEYPDVPTYPASHGCVRVPSPEAKAVYRFAALETAVVVL